MLKKDFELITTGKEKIIVSVFGIENISNSPCLFIVHGFMGFKDWGFYPYTAGYFAQKGFSVITFNFSHNGIGDNPYEITDLDKFSQNTYLIEKSELPEVIDAYKNNFFGNVGNNKIGLLGHSMGGAISIFTASERSDISAVAAWAGISTVDRYTEHQKMMWKEKGSLIINNRKKGQPMKLNVSFLEDIENNKDSSLNIQKAIGKLNCPLLLAQGEQDLSVLVKDAEDLYSWSKKEYTELFFLKATGHTFNVKHPFEGTNLKLEELLAKTTEFFNKHLMG